MTSRGLSARDETGVFRDCPGKYPRGEEDGNGDAGCFDGHRPGGTDAFGAGFTNRRLRQTPLNISISSSVPAPAPRAAKLSFDGRRQRCASVHGTPRARACRAGMSFATPPSCRPLDDDEDDARYALAAAEAARGALRERHRAAAEREAPRRRATRPSPKPSAFARTC